MLWTLFVLLLLAWLIGVVVVGVTGFAIHILLIVAGILLVTRLVGGKGKK
jgi:preprotein translocase subunit Sss1